MLFSNSKFLNLCQEIEALKDTFVNYRVDQSKFTPTTNIYGGAETPSLMVNSFEVPTLDKYCLWDSYGIIDHNKPIYDSKNLRIGAHKLATPSPTAINPLSKCLEAQVNTW